MIELLDKENLNPVTPLRRSKRIAAASTPFCFDDQYNLRPRRRSTTSNLPISSHVTSRDTKRRKSVSSISTRNINDHNIVNISFCRLQKYTSTTDDITLDSLVNFSTTILSRQKSHIYNGNNKKLSPICEPISNLKLNKEYKVVTPSYGSYIPSSDEIQNHMAKMFNFYGVIDKACVSARLFACISFIIDKNHFFNANSETASLNNPLHALLKAFVAIELSSLKDVPNTINSSNENRRVQFCSFDSSTISSPVDNIRGSHSILEHSINSIYNAIQKIDCILRSELSLSQALTKIKEFIDIMHFFESNDGIRLRQACSQAMPYYWPIERFIEACKYYRSEFQKINKHLMKNPDEDRNCVSNKLSMEERLGDLIWRAIRFYLRKSFNTIPETMDPNDPYSSCCRSRVHQIVCMNMKENNGQKDTAVADGSISSVFTRALRYVYNFYEMTNQLDLDQNQDVCPRSFCNREASKKGLHDGDKMLKLTENDVKDVLLDISETHTILAGIRGCKFIKELMTCPGVMEAVEEVDGFSKIESFANIFVQCNLKEICTDEQQCILLQNIKSFIKKLERNAHLFDQIEKNCENSLRDLWLRFRCGTRNSYILTENPGLLLIKNELKLAKEIIFPSIEQK